MRIQLLQHNKVAYQKVIKTFEYTNRTCVVHPTGTGKSYLIAAVSEKYKNVLILGPNVFVLNQVRDVIQWRHEGVSYMTYQMLVFMGEVPTGYDLICLDEFHRIGAPGWGERVDELLKANPNAKIFGTTALGVVQYYQYQRLLQVFSTSIILLLMQKSASTILKSSHSKKNENDYTS